MLSIVAPPGHIQRWGPDNGLHPLSSGLPTALYSSACNPKSSNEELLGLAHFLASRSKGQRLYNPAGATMHVKIPRPPTIPRREILRIREPCRVNTGTRSSRSTFLNPHSWYQPTHASHPSPHHPQLRSCRTREKRLLALIPTGGGKGG